MRAHVCLCVCMRVAESVHFCAIVIAQRYQRNHLLVEQLLLTAIAAIIRLLFTIRVTATTFRKFGLSFEWCTFPVIYTQRQFSATNFQLVFLIFKLLSRK